jgi:hypothetical protein
MARSSELFRTNYTRVKCAATVPMPKRKRSTGPSGPSSLVELFAVIGIRGKVPTVLSCCPAEAVSGASALANVSSAAAAPCA